MKILVGTPIARSPNMTSFVVSGVVPAGQSGSFTRRKDFPGVPLLELKYRH